MVTVWQHQNQAESGAAELLQINDTREKERSAKTVDETETLCYI